jgi:hypothetical protein
MFLLFACVGRAQEERLAEREFHRGLQAYDAGSFVEAAGAFAASYAQDPRPALLFNEAQAWRRDWETRADRGSAQRAIARYGEYLRSRQIAEHERLEAVVHMAELSSQLASHPEPPPEPPKAQVTLLPPQPPPPARRRTALWVGLGVGAGVVAAALAVGLGVGLSNRSPSGDPTVSWK